jgi:DNA modification methylase
MKQIKNELFKEGSKDFQLRKINKNIIKLYKGDCLIKNEHIESGCVDLILTDLPYGTVKDLGNNDNINHGMKGKTVQV